MIFLYSLVILACLIIHLATVVIYFFKIQVKFENHKKLTKRFNDTLLIDIMLVIADLFLISRTGILTFSENNFVKENINKNLLQIFFLIIIIRQYKAELLLLGLSNFLLVMKFLQKNFFNLLSSLSIFIFAQSLLYLILDEIFDTNVSFFDFFFEVLQGKSDIFSPIVNLAFIHTKHIVSSL